jgi:hypothetical protein
LLEEAKLGGLLGRNWPFSRSFAVPTYEQTKRRQRTRGRRRAAAKDSGEGQEGRRTAKESDEGQRRTTKQETIESFQDRLREDSGREEGRRQRTAAKDSGKGQRRAKDDGRLDSEGRDCKIVLLRGS